MHYVHLGTRLTWLISGLVIFELKIDQEIISDLILAQWTSGASLSKVMAAKTCGLQICEPKTLNRAIAYVNQNREWEF